MAVSSAIWLLTSPCRRLSWLTSRHPSSCSAFEPSLGRLLQSSSYWIGLVRRRFSSFFDDQSVVVARVAIYREPVYISGDFNIRLDHPYDPHADQLRLLVDCYGLVMHATGPTHQLGGTLDAVITLNSVGHLNCVAIEDVGISDHFLLRWEVHYHLLATVASAGHRVISVGNIFFTAMSAGCLARGHR
jgi:hypothetical protein